MSSSDEEEDSILDQILPGRLLHPKLVPGPEIPAVVPSLQPTIAHKQRLPTPPPVKPATLLGDSPESDVEIPSVFLTQGEKNRRLLRQNEEIQRQIDSDNSRELARAQEINELRSEFLRELNYNGAGFEYTPGHDLRYVQDLVDLYLRKDPELGLRRHFYFFSAPQLAPGGSGADHVGDKAENGISCTLNALLRTNNVPQLSKLHSCVLQNDSKDYFGAVSFADAMAGLGAGDPAHSRLKLAHFNDNLAQVVLKAGIIMLVGLDLCRTAEDVQEIARHLYLASSDFLLNKHQRTLLCTALVGPVLERYVCRGGSEELAAEFGRMVGHVALVTCGPEPVLCAEQKQAEMHHNFLENALSCDLSAEALRFVELLAAQFVGADMSLAGLTTKIHAICTPDLSDADAIHRGVYQMQLAARYVQQLVYSGGRADAPQVLICRKRILQSKGALQQAVGAQLYVDGVQKAQVARSLSKTYHFLDSLTRVLDKMVLFLGTDGFYDLGSDDGKTAVVK